MKEEEREMVTALSNALHNEYDYILCDILEKKEPNVSDQEMEYFRRLYKLLRDGIEDEKPNKVYRIWSRGYFTSGGFFERFDEVWEHSKVYSTRDAAERDMPTSSNYTGHSTEYYIMEEEIK